MTTMRLIEIRDLLEATPFQPFRICMSDESTHDVSNPNLVFLTSRSVMIGVLTNAEGFPDDVIRCDPLHVRQLQPIEPAA